VAAIEIRTATPSDSEYVCSLALMLLSELYPEMYSLDQLKPVVARILTQSNDVVAFIAMHDDQAIGLITVNRCTAIYAFGDFGEISELYVDPKFRSSGLGARLLQKAVGHAEAQGWSMLEVGAPDVPKWQRTVDFYVANEFSIVGPRLYRLITDK